MVIVWFTYGIDFTGEEDGFITLYPFSSIVYPYLLNKMFSGVAAKDIPVSLY